MRACAIAVILLTLSTFVSALEHTREPVEEIKKAVDDGKAVIVDVREKREWTAGHLTGALLVPLSELNETQKVPDTIPKDKPIYVHCMVGGRALTATEILKKLGYDARAVGQKYGELCKTFGEVK